MHIWVLQIWSIWSIWSERILQKVVQTRCSCWYSVLLGQNRAVLVASMMSFQKIYGLHGLNHQIIGVDAEDKLKKAKVEWRNTIKFLNTLLPPSIKLLNIRRRTK